MKLGQGNTYISVLQVSRPTQVGGGVFRGVEDVYPSMHSDRHLPEDGYCCEQCASYWNAFLFFLF